MALLVLLVFGMFFLGLVLGYYVGSQDGWARAVNEAGSRRMVLPKATPQIHEPPGPPPTRAAPAPTSILKEDYPIDVAGEGEFQQHLRELVGPTDGTKVHKPMTAVLRPEPDNLEDPGAIVVQINGGTVGYLGKPKAKRHRGRIGRGVACRALIRGGARLPNYVLTQFGVFLADPETWEPIE